MDFNKKQKIIVLIFLIFGLTLTSLNFQAFNSLQITDNFEESNTIDFDDQNTLPKTTDYQTFGSSGEQFNVTLHQSLIDTTTKQFSNIDASNSFTEPFPIFSGYNTSLVDISINNINAPNKTLNLELGTTSNDQISWDLLSYSFRIRTTCLIQNLSIYLSESGGSGGAVDVRLFIYNATWNGAQSRIEPDTDTGVIDITENVPDEDTGQWYNYTINKELDATNTYNKTFFVYVYQNTNPAVARAYYHYETGSTTDNLITYRDSGGGWQEIARNISSQIILGLNDNTPIPSNINLQINGTAVTDIGVTNTGYWRSTQEYEGLNGNLDFEITADWWEVSCDVSNVQINYTKSDIQATSSFDILGSGSDVNWNVTIPSGLNYFDNRISNYNTINFTIPRIWNNPSIKVFNGSIDKTSDIVKRLINSKYREIQVLNAGNGTYWHLNATSSNLFSSIDTFVGGIALSKVNHSNTVRFNATFIETINDGMLNLSVFTPSQGYLNHTRNLDLTPLGSDTNFTLSDWDVSVNVTEYGVFKIQVSWSNDTAAGFLEDFIRVVADTDLTLSVPKFTFDSGDVFNMTVFYEDTGQILGIQADDIYYQIGSGPIRRDNIDYIGNGYYNITFSCNDADFSYGPNTIEVNVEKTYYNNQTDSRVVTVIAETDANILYPSINRIFDSGDTFYLAIHYNDTVQDLGIASATIEYSLDGGLSYRTDGIAYIGSGQYNITISADDSDFSGYGAKQIIVNTSRQYYHNQSRAINIKILGETSLSGVRVPDQVYYTAAETFSISVNYRDIVKSLGITGATVTVDVDGAAYSPASLDDNLDGYYNISIDCSDSIFDGYGLFAIRVNVSLVNYYNQTTTLNTLIVGNESLYVVAPNFGAVYTVAQSFNITVEYLDTILSTGIDGATIEYSLDGGSTYKPDNVVYIGSGQYNITIDVNDADFISYGFVDVYIDASKQYYENRSTTYNFHRQITTQITPQNTADLGTVIKGLSVNYTFTYEDTNLNPIESAFWTQISTPVGFTSLLENLGNGDYRMNLDTTNVLVTGVPYDFEFSIYAVGNETQILTLTVDVLIIETDVINVTYISEIARNLGLNQSVRFYFNDTTNNQPVPNVLTQNIVVKNNATGTPFNVGEYWLFDPFSNGTYILDITMGTRISGWYILEINASRFPNYDVTLFYVSFYYRGNYTDINLISLSDPAPGVLSPIGLNNYTIYEGSDITVEFNITDPEDSDSLIIGDADSYTVRYTNLGTGSNGILVANLNFVTQLHTGTILTSNPALTMGRYLLNITTSRTNYEDAWYAFNLTIIARHQTNLTKVFVPPQINSGDEFSIIIRASFFNGTDWLPLVSGTIRMTPYFNGIVSTVQTLDTNITGEITFYITTGSSLRTVNITLELLVEYNYLGYTDDISALEITVIPPTPPLSFKDLLPYIIMIGAVAVVVVASLATYRGVIVPKKREKQRVLTEVKTIFDDAINLEHILVLYKGTGTCIFFKSYGSEQIDPELIGGFLSAVSSFGKEMATQEALNEISYGDKMLLLADGNLIRVALVLGKNASLILRRHLKEFIGTFEKTYNEVLPNWRGQLNYFKNAGLIVDDLLNTSIILPHQISYDFSSVKDLKNTHSKEVLKVAQSCCEETEREFFFIATLLKDASEMTSKDTAEIFMGIKELRDKKILIPIEISTIEAHPISQQELNLINQKVVALPNLTNDEKQKLVQDLSQLGPIEREAYLTSLSKQNEIVTAPIKTTTVEGVDVDNKKSAKKGVRELMKRGKIADGKKDHVKAIEFYQTAAALASNWELTDDYVRIEEIIRKTKIEDLKEKKSQLEKEAKDAVKAKNYTEAAGKFKYASKMASEIFKLGDTSMTKEVKRLTNKSNEYEKLK